MATDVQNEKVRTLVRASPHILNLEVSLGLFRPSRFHCTYFKKVKGVAKAAVLDGSGIFILIVKNRDMVSTAVRGS
jgi:hypothetical protein